MAWEIKATAAQLTTIDNVTEQFFDKTPTTVPGEAFVLQVQAAFGASPVEDAIFAVYSTLDDSSELWDTEPIMEFLLEAVDSASVIRSFSIRSEDAYKFRVGVRATGSVDTINSADLSFRRDNVTN